MAGTHTYPCYICTLEYNSRARQDRLNFPAEKDEIDLTDFNNSEDSTVQNIDQIVTQIYNLLKPQSTPSTSLPITIVAKIKISDDPQVIFCFVDVRCSKTEIPLASEDYFVLAKKLNGYTQKNKLLGYTIDIGLTAIAVMAAAFLCWNHWNKTSNFSQNAIKIFLENIPIRTTITS